MSELEALRLDTKMTPIAELRPHERNPRTILPERLEALKENLREDPGMLWARPLIALPDGRVVAGNQRLRAAQELGWESIPAVVADLDEDAAVVWALRDNRPFGQDDFDLTMQLLSELRDRNVPLVLTGFSQAELDDLLFDLSSVDPVGEDEQGKLDQLTPPDPVVCPHCGESFVPARK